MELVEVCASVHVVHPVTEYAVHQAGELGCHGLDRDRSAQLGCSRRSVASSKSGLGSVLSFRYTHNSTDFCRIPTLIGVIDGKSNTFL